MYFFDCKGINRKTGKEIIFEVPVNISYRGIGNIARNIKLISPEPNMTASFCKNIYEGTRDEISQVLKRHLPDPSRKPARYLFRLQAIHETIRKIARIREGAKEKLSTGVLDIELDRASAPGYQVLGEGCSSTLGWENRKGGS